MLVILCLPLPQRRGLGQCLCPGWLTFVTCITWTRSMGNLGKRQEEREAEYFFLFSPVVPAQRPSPEAPLSWLCCSICSLVPAALRW